MLFHAEHALAKAERAYVTLMMAVVGRAIVAASETDPDIRRDLAALPTGFVIQVLVRPHGPWFAVEVCEGGRLALLHETPAHVSLGLNFKHVALAFLVLTFQKGMARAYADNHLYVDGDVSHAIRIVRCLSRLEVLILPKLIAEHAVKHYPAITLDEKVPLAARIYEHMAINLVQGD